MDAFYKTASRPYRLVALGVLSLLCILLMASPLAVFPLGAIAAIIYYTAKDPSNDFALQVDGRNHEAVEDTADSSMPSSLATSSMRIRRRRI